MRSLAVTLLLACFLAAQRPQFAYVPPEPRDDGLTVGTLRDAALDEATIVALTEEISEGTFANIHSLLIIRRDRLVYERYFPGIDENREGTLGLVHHSRDTLHDVRSVTKSVVALATLIAHAQGHIKNLETPLADLLPQYSSHLTGDKRGLSLKHALTMTAGLEWSEPAGPLYRTSPAAAMNVATDPIEFVLTRRLITKPGTVFNYNGGLTQVLAAVIRKTTGVDVAEFTRRHLLAPLGITRFEWARMENGFLDADSGLRLRSRDLAKLGVLLTSRGTWQGRQILPPALVGEALAEHVALPAGSDAVTGDAQSYGYQIWRFSFLTGGRRIQIIELSGNGGQKVILDEARDTIVVMTAGNYDRTDLKKWPFDMYTDFILPAMLESDPRGD